MATINAGTVTLGEGTYEVILRPVGGNKSNAGNSSAPTNKKNTVPKNKQNGGKTRKLSSYMKFAQEVRPKLMKDHPELKSDIPGTGRKIGEMWRGLSDEEKKRY